MINIAHDWRLRGQRYRLEGEECPHCGHKTFPPRDICPECKHATQKFGSDQVCEEDHTPSLVPAAVLSETQSESATKKVGSERIGVQTST